jgi:hypothetical protein
VFTAKFDFVHSSVLNTIQMENDISILRESPTKSNQPKHDSVLSVTRSNKLTPPACYSRSILDQLHSSTRPSLDDERSIQSEDEVSFKTTPVKILKDSFQETFNLVMVKKTGQKAQFDARRFKSAFQLIESLHRNEYPSDWLLIRRKLTIAEYDRLLEQVARNPSLQEYLDNKLRCA